MVQIFRIFWYFFVHVDKISRFDEIQEVHKKAGTQAFDPSTGVDNQNFIAIRNFFEYLNQLCNKLFV